MITTTTVEADARGVRFIMEVEVSFSLDGYADSRPDVDNVEVVGIWQDGVQVDEWPEWAHDTIERELYLAIYGD